MRRLMVIVGLLLVASLLVSVSCGRATAPLPGITVPGQVGAAPGAGSSKEDTSATSPSVITERMIVRQGDMSLVVKSVGDVRDEIAQLAVSLDGYVVSSSIWGEGEEMRGSISIRVPDEKFDPALAELRKLAVRVERESTNSQDVTEQYTDLQARLNNAKATEKQYLALMDKATTVEDMLKIQDSLSRVRTEIEQIQGQMQYLERTSSMSLITASLQPAASARPLTPVGWNPMEVLKAAIRGFITFGKWLVNIAIWLLIFLPVWGTVLGIVYWRLRRRRRVQ